MDYINDCSDIKLQNYRFKELYKIASFRLKSAQFFEEGTPSPILIPSAPSASRCTVCSEGVIVDDNYLYFAPLPFNHKMKQCPSPNFLFFSINIRMTIQKFMCKSKSK